MMKKVKARIFARQMFHLALADLLSSVTEILWIMEPMTKEKGVESLSICGTFHCFVAVSVLIETQVALSFALAHARCTCLLRCFLGRALVFTWVLGIGIGCWSIDAIDYEESWGMCILSKHHVPGQEVFIGALIASFGISAVAYATCLYFTCTGDTPGSVEGQIKSRILLYPLNFFITYVPFGILLSFPHLSSSALLPMALLSRSLNGFLNALTYAGIFFKFHSTTRKHPIQEQTSDEDNDPLGFADFHVRFAGVETHFLTVLTLASSSPTVIDAGSPPMSFDTRNSPPSSWALRPVQDLIGAP
jgi:hypothetical protein